MKILIVAGTFPPYAPSSASRANKFAKYLEQNGHDVKVLAPKLPNQGNALTPEISMDQIIFTEYYDINSFPHRVKTCFKNMFASSRNDVDGKSGAEKIAENKIKSKQEGKISFIYRWLTNIPDNTIGWYPAAIREGRRLFSTWSPDIIFASAPPYTGFIVAKKLSKMNNCPWVADYRDLWIDESNAEFNTVRGRINKLVENWFLSNCDGLVTVTQNWSARLNEKHSIPVTLAMNGFDPDDFHGTTKNILFSNHFTILYAGDLYDNKRDPLNLLKAIGQLGEKAEKIKFLFYTPDGVDDLNDHHKEVIAQYNLHDQIVCHKFIPQGELHNIQLGVDLLLLLRWDDPRENGVIAGKLFEYIGAGKQILSVGSTTGEAADIIRDNNFGLVSNNVEEIKNYLEQRLEEKENGIDLNPVNPNKEKYSRAIQFEKIETFLQDIVANKE